MWGGGGGGDGAHRPHAHLWVGDGGLRGHHAHRLSVQLASQIAHLLHKLQQHVGLRKRQRGTYVSLRLLMSLRLGACTTTQFAESHGVNHIGDIREAIVGVVLPVIAGSSLAHTLQKVQRGHERKPVL